MNRRTRVETQARLSRPPTAPRARAGLAAVLLVAGAGIAAGLVPTGVAAAGNALVDITHVTLPGDRQQLALTMSGPAEAPESFTIDNPARIALDLADTANELDDKRVAISAGLLQNVTTVEAGGRTRVVVNLASLTPYSTAVRGNQLLVTLDGDVGNAPGDVTVDASATAAQAARAARVVQGRDARIESLDFRRGPMGEGRVIFKLSSPGIAPDMRAEGGRIVVDFPDTELAASLQKRLDVMDFGTPVQFIDAISSSRGAKVVIEPATQEFEQLAYQSDDMFTVELKPMSAEDIEENRRAKFGYVGEKLSLNFQDIEVRSVLQLLADFTDLNVVVSDSVQGKLTLRLKNVPWDQALAIILQTKGLAMRETGNVIMIAPADEVAERERVELEAQKAKTELAPLRTEYFQANYAKAEELAALLQSATGRLLSERGTVTVDERTNTMLINDTAERLSEIRGLMHRLDVPIRQVLIESRIVIASDAFNKDLGVRWGVNRNTVSDDGEGFLLSGNGNGVTNLGNGEALGNERYNINLPISNPAGTLGVALAKLPFGTLLELELSAMQSEGKGEVISSPRVITANQHEAYIEQGVEIPYVEASSSGATSISFRKAVLGLTVKPQITPDDRVVMDLNVSRDTVGEIFGSGNAAVPSIDSREVSTQVLVDNGETVVLGGIYEQTLLNTRDAVPFFGNLPLIGRLFQRNRHTDDKSELLVFVTPKIIKENVSLTY